MSRCRGCGNAFDEDDCWQEFCSAGCAMRSVVGRVVGEDDKAAGSKAWRMWAEWFGMDANRRRVRDGPPARSPGFGSLVRRVVRATAPDGTCADECVAANVGGEIAPCPMTDADRRLAARQRGRGSFGDCMAENATWRALPGSAGRVGEGWFIHD